MPTIPLRPTRAERFEVDTDRSHPIRVVRPFALEVLDAWGKPVVGRFVSLTPPGGKATGRVTDAAGTVRLFDTVMEGDVTVEVDAVEPVDEPLARPVEVDGAVPYDGSPIALPGQRTGIVQLPLRVVRVRLVGMLFETDKTFLLPSALGGIRQLSGIYAQYPVPAVLVVGHTDATGTEGYNQSLSEQRALAVAAYLQDDADDWLARYEGQPVGEPWGVREDKYMLSHLLDADGNPFYSGPIDEIDWDEGTRETVRRFQTSANAIERAGLAVDGWLGAKTRRPLVTRYMGEDGTTLPENATLQTHGCGEHHPVDPTPDGVASAPNRRTEVFFFEGEVTPEPSGDPEPCAEYPQWVAHLSTTIDIGNETSVLLGADWEF